jgi:hypothetical protein
MINCIRCDDNTTVDYIALGTIAEPVCMDCIDQDEQAQLDFEQSERNLEEFQDAQGEGNEMALEDFIKIEGGY